MTPLDSLRGTAGKCPVIGDWCHPADLPCHDPATGEKYWPCMYCGRPLWPVTKLSALAPHRPQARQPLEPDHTTVTQMNGEDHEPIDQQRVCPFPHLVHRAVPAPSGQDPPRSGSGQAEPTTPSSMNGSRRDGHLPSPPKARA